MKLLLIVFLGVLGLAFAQECNPNQFPCDNGRCIPGEWECDGDNDCGDGSDEDGCLCDGFKCSTGRCIPDGYVCDGDNDCGDWEDEQGCPCDGFKCPAGRCIPDSYVCDGDNDCGDYADETDCASCPGYTCEETRRCIPDRAICDGNDDCGDGSDETEEACPCNEGEYRCAKPPGSNVPGPCIPPEWLCDEDGIWDCPDGSDQANCTMPVKTTRTKLVPHHKKTHRGSSLRKLMKLSAKERKTIEKRQRKAKSLYAFLHKKPRKEKKMKL